MKIAICDDSAEDRRQLHELVKEYEQKNNLRFTVTFFESYGLLMSALQKSACQIVFLKLAMDGVSVVDAAAEIRGYDRDAAIVFTSLSAEYTISDKRTRGVYYLLRPITYAWFFEVVNLCKLQQPAFTKSIELPVGKGNSQILLDDLIYAEISPEGLAVHTTRGALQSAVSLEQMEDLAGDAAFLRCHRDYVVNMAHIASDTPDAFLLDSGEMIPISRPNRAIVKKLYNEYVFSGMGG